jgi:hypothetical protein
MTTSTKQRPALRAVINTGSREAPAYQEVGAAWPHKRGFTLLWVLHEGGVAELWHTGYANSECGCLRAR